MTYTVPTPEEVSGPTTGDDRPLLVAYLQFQRTTLLNICAGLTAEQLVARPIPSTGLTLLGLVRHLAKVERVWFRERVACQDIEPLYGGAGNPEDFDTISADTARQEVSQLEAEWAACDSAVADIPLDHEILTREQRMSLHFIYLHVIAEYARHNGHADLIREAIDGTRGR